MSFKTIKNEPGRNRRPAARRLMTLAECWAYFRKSVIPADAEPAAVDRARMVFYAGAAFYQDQVLLLGERRPGLNDDKRVEMLECLARELDEFAGELAVDVAFKMPIPSDGRTH